MHRLDSGELQGWDAEIRGSQPARVVKKAARRSVWLRRRRRLAIVTIEKASEPGRNTRCGERAGEAKLGEGSCTQLIPRSSNGRTAAFGAVNRGSNPCRGAIL
jgi:hypothetical protein